MTLAATLAFILAAVVAGVLTATNMTYGLLASRARALFKRPAAR